MKSMQWSKLFGNAETSSSRFRLLGILLLVDSGSLRLDDHLDHMVFDRRRLDDFESRRRSGGSGRSFVLDDENFPAIKQNRRLEIIEQQIRLEVRVEELSSNETILQQTLTTAQQLSEDLKNTAMKEAELRIGEAEVQAEKILDAAHRRATKLAEDLREMKQIRTRLTASVRATIDTHLALLDALAKDPPEEPSLGANVAYLARSGSGTAQPDLDV